MTFRRTAAHTIGTACYRGGIRTAFPASHRRRVRTLVSIITLVALLALLPFTSFGQNVAQGKTASATGTLAAGKPVGNVNDGNVTTFTHPLEGTTTSGFFFEVDLGQDYALHHLSIVNRGDGSFPERLTNYRVALLADAGGAPGGVLWEATIRSDGTNSGVGGTDTVYAGASTNPAHQFHGRYVRITNLSGADSNPQLAEVQAWIVSAGSNVALGRPVIASGATWPGLTPNLLTDGGRSGTNTISHPANGVATNGFYFQTDLGAEYALNRVVLWNRDNCCPERLSNYRVILYADNNGSPGAVLWQADIRTDGTNSGQGGSDTILKTASTNPAHQFRGRFLRVQYLGTNANSPQIAEIEAFPEPPPTINYFRTDAGNIAGPGLPATATLSWSVTNAESVTISGIGTVAATGTATVSPAAPTTYLLTAIRAGSATIHASVTIAVNATQVAPQISEFQAADGLLEDETGDRPDWIELYNPNTFTLVLTNYTLTDNPLQPAKWTFPLANIPAGGYLIVFASGNDRREVGKPLHTNFSLSNSGEYLALHAPGGALLHRYPASYPTPATFPQQYDRSSYGIASGGAVKYFKPASPGYANGSGFDGVVADTSFSVKRGIYSSPQFLTITSATSGATIRYTTNGSEPTETNGTTYTGPINVTSTRIIRAAAFKAGMIPTNVDTHTYIFPSDVVTQPTMSTTITQDPTYGPQMVSALTDLPSFSVVTPATIVNGTSVPCSVEYIPKTGAAAHENGGVEQFGGAFTNFQKKNFRLAFKSEFGATKMEIPGLFANHARGWLPVEKFDELELRSGSHDMAMRGFYMANIFTDAVMFELGSFSVHSRFVHLYQNGVYWGVYHLRERWSAAHHAAYFGGPKEDHEAINGNANVGGWADPGDPYDGDGTSWQRIKSLRSNYAGIKPYLDVQQYVDYMTMWMFGNSENEYRTVGPKNAGSGFKFVLNDADGYLAVNAWDGNSDNTQRTNPPPGRLNGDGPGGLLSALHFAGDSDFRMLVADRMHRALFGNGALTPAANAARLTELCAEFQRPFLAESARWVSGGQSRTPASWATARDEIFNNWFPTRTSTVINQFRTAGFYPTQVAPAFTGGAVASGTVVNFPVAGSTVYYTKDGSDPRLPGGNVNPAASTGSSTTITSNTWLRARSRNGTTWSALNEAFYSTTGPLVAGDVVFSEIHFNPQGDDDTEFIELWNPTNRAVNLRGAKFVAGLRYEFSSYYDTVLPPGGRAVLVASQYNFQKRYGLNVPIVGVYFDRLGNDGDTLSLASAGGTQLFSISYSDIAPWPDSADGDGFSLILANPAAPSNPGSWRTSTAANGNPAGTDSTTFSGNGSADADHDGLTALAEHFFNTLDIVPTPIPTIVGRTVDGRATITFTRRLSADDVGYAVEVSGNLTSWSGDTTRIAHINHGDGTATETWRANPFSSVQFMRVRLAK